MLLCTKQAPCRQCAEDGVKKHFRTLTFNPTEHLRDEGVAVADWAQSSFLKTGAYYINKLWNVMARCPHTSGNVAYILYMIPQPCWILNSDWSENCLEQELWKWWRCLYTITLKFLTKGFAVSSTTVTAVMQFNNKISTTNYTHITGHN